MYTIKMCNDKSLLTIKHQPIYSGENNSNTIDFFIPKIYESRDLSEAIVQFDYILPNGVSGFCTLNKDEKGTYEDFNLYELIITSYLTFLTGRVRFWLTISNEADGDMIIKTSESYFDVIPSVNVTYGKEDIDRIQKEIQDLRATKADNITMDNNQNLSLLADGNPIGDKVPLNEIVNLDNNSNNTL